MRSFIITSLVLIACSGCVATRNADRMYVIQRNDGFYTQSLWYRGSTRKYHYLKQERHSNMGFFSPSTTKLFRVPTTQLTVRDELIFPYDPGRLNQLKVRMRSGPPYVVALRKSSLSEVSKKIEDFRKEPMPEK